MKLIQSNDQMVIKQGGAGQLIAGLIFIIIGIGVAVVFFGGLLPADSNGRHAPILIGLIGLLFAGIGLVLLRSAQNRTITIQKGGETTIMATKIIGHKAAKQSFPTANIVGVRLNTYMDVNNVSSNNGGSSNNQRRSDLSLLLNNNDSIQVGNAGSNSGFTVNGMNVGSLIQKAPPKQRSRSVSNFLGRNARCSGYKYSRQHCKFSSESG